MRPFTLLPLLNLCLHSIRFAPLAAASENFPASSHASESLLFFDEMPRHRNLESDDFIDFTELLDPSYADAVSDTDSFLALVSDVLLLLKDYVHTRDDSGNLRINELIGGLTDDEGFIEFGIKDGYFLDLGTGSAVNLTSVGVKGLDTFLQADLLQPTKEAIVDENATDVEGNNYDDDPETTLQNTFKLETLVLDLYLTEKTNGRAEETLKIRLPFAGVDVSAMPIVLAVFEDGLKNFPVGAALNHTDLLSPCLADTVMDQAVILALEASFEEIGVPQMIEDSNIKTESPFLGVVTTLFVGLPASVPIFFNSTVRGLLNDMLKDNLLEPETEIKDPCPSYPTSKDLEKEQDLIEFPSFFETGLPALLMTLLEDEIIAINPDTGLPKINNVLIVPLMDELGDQDVNTQESGKTSMVFGAGDEALVDVSTNLAIGGLSADIKLRLSDLAIYNLDTMIPPIELLQPISEEPQQLNNTITMGLDMEENPERSMGLSANVFLSIVTDDDGQIEHDLRLQANMEEISIVLTALLQIVQPKLYGFPVKDILNLQCWLATLKAPDIDSRTGIRLESECPTVGIAKLMASMAKMNMDVACNDDCTSVGMEEWIDLMQTPEAQEGMTETMNSALDYAASLLSEGGALLQTPIDRILSEASMQCPHNPAYDPGAILPVEYEEMDALPEHEYSYEYLILWGSLAGGLVLAFCAMAIGVRCSARCKHRRWLAGTDVSSKKKSILSEKQRRQDELEDALNSSTNSMFYSSEIPVLIRWSMPVIILGNVALFLSGHLNLGATVYIEANVAGDTIKVGDFFDFAIARTTIDLWKAGGKALALLILFFSGIWPYTKQFLTLALWFMPTKRMSISTRGTCLIWLDRLAKWSMIDIFVIVVCIAAFRVSVMSPEVSFLPEEFYSINLMVVPMWGLYSNMTAQLVSQLSSHFIIYYHRCIVKKATQNLSDNTGGEEEAKPGRKGNGSKILLGTHSFSNPYYESTEKLVPKNWVGLSILVSSMFMAGLVVLGSFIPSFSVELLGIIGVAVESGQEFEEAITQHSVWSIVMMLFDEARFLDTMGAYIGVGVLGSLVLATVMVVPILQAIFLMCQWFVPLRENTRRRLSVVNEIFQAWQYIEVYLIALFVASWQLGPVSQYMFNAYCGSLDGFFAQMVSYGILKEADAQCFSVQGSIDPGSIALLVAAILLALVNSVVTLASKQCLDDYSAPLDRQAQQILPLEPSEAAAVETHPNSDNENTEETAIVETHPNSDNENSENENTEETANSTKIRPPPFVFTDIHRWLLRSIEITKDTDNV